jgi:hypothetical protein
VACIEAAPHRKEPIMLDRLFMPALTFTLLVAATAAFAAEFAVGPGARETQQIVTLERVVVTATREFAPVAQATQAEGAVTLR